MFRRSPGARRRSVSIDTEIQSAGSEEAGLSQPTTEGPPRCHIDVVCSSSAQLPPPSMSFMNGPNDPQVGGVTADSVEASATPQRLSGNCFESPCAGSGMATLPEIPCPVSTSPPEIKIQDVPGGQDRQNLDDDHIRAPRRELDPMEFVPPMCCVCDTLGGVGEIQGGGPASPSGTFEECIGDSNCEDIHQTVFVLGMCCVCGTLGRGVLWVRFKAVAPRVPAGLLRSAMEIVIAKAFIRQFASLNHAWVTAMDVTIPMAVPHQLVQILSGSSPSQVWHFVVRRQMNLN